MSKTINKLLSIGQLGKRFGLSRSTLLYYDSIGLLKPSGRSTSNYRLYSSEDVQRLQRIRTYREAGLPLQEIERILLADESRISEALHQRMSQLNADISGLRKQQQIITTLLGSEHIASCSRIMDKQRWTQLLEASGIDDEGMRCWHQEFEQRAPEAHQDFLESLGIEPEEIRSIRERFSQ